MGKTKLNKGDTILCVDKKEAVKIMIALGKECIESEIEELENGKALLTITRGEENG